MNAQYVLEAFILISLVWIGCGGQSKASGDLLIYSGTYTEADSQGIELYNLNPQTGTLSFVGTAVQTENPSYIRISSDGYYLYAVNELVDPAGHLSAFKIDSVTGNLQFLNSIPSSGRAPCYLELSADDQFVLFNNYLDGIAGVQALTGDGKLGPTVTRLQFTGSGPNSARQEASHVHSITLDAQNELVVVADLGTDKLTVFKFDIPSGSLQKLSETQTAPGAGPRHTCFTADGKTLFVANELNSTVEVFAVSRQSGQLNRIQTISTLPADFSGINYPADIHLSPDGRFLYVSNRGHESLAIFSVDNRQLAFQGTVNVGGSWPRNFTISKDGRWLIVANQKSRNLVVFKRNANTGQLTRKGQSKTIATPACVKIYE